MILHMLVDGIEVLLCIAKMGIFLNIIAIIVQI